MPMAVVSVGVEILLVADNPGSSANGGGASETASVSEDMDLGAEIGGDD